MIDEVHSLLRGDRGGQTLCLIERLCTLAGVRPRRIGLSATIGDPVTVGNLLSSGSGRRTQIPQIREPAIRWRLSMGHFPVGGPPGTPEQQPDSSGTDDPDRTDRAPEHADPGLGFIFEHTRGKKCLVFTNSREECEAVTSTLRRYCEQNGEPDRFLIHHGNLSASYREGAEAAMKDESRADTTVTTATLELGIDIGRLERAFQIDAPFTVSAFLQRMGRTGRRGQPPEMWFVIREERPEARAMLPAFIPWPLLQAVALVQLYRKERWVEPPKLDRLPFSLLYHQTMAILASGGERTPAELASQVRSLSSFHRISKEDYRLLLRHLLETGQIERTPEGGVIVGLAGERVTNSFQFYAVFKENEEFTVRQESQEIGTIVRPPPVGEKIALAGKVWIVEEIDYKRRLIYCNPVRGKVPAYFGQCPGDIHTRILEEMLQVLRGEDTPPYLMKNAAARLAEARHTARRAGMTDSVLLPLGGESWCLFPWLGTYAFLALERFLKKHPSKYGTLECVKNRIKYDSYMWNYERLATKFKYIFIERAAEEFREDMRNGTLQKDYFEWYKWKKLFEIIDDPIAFHTNHMLEDYTPSTGNAEIEKILNSKTYKFAKIVTFIPRKAAGGIQCAKDHGIPYTIRLALKKISHIK